MTVIGVELKPDLLVLTKNRDFRWQFQNTDDQGNLVDYPAGSLKLEFDTSPVVTWDFTIDGPTASIKVESEAVSAIASRTRWQLVFYLEGESSGGDPIGLGTTKIQR